MEKMERDERRGLEARASASIAALLIATGLVVNSRPVAETGYLVTAGVFVALAFVLSFFPLIGLHTTTDTPSVGAAVMEALRTKGPPTVPFPEDDPAAEHETQHRRVEKLVEANVVAVTCLRVAGFLTILGAYTLLVGLLFS